MTHSERRHRGDAFSGILFLFVGVFFLLHNLGIVPLAGNTASWWPLLLCLIGLSSLIHSARIFDFGDWLLILLGIAFLAAEQRFGGVTWGNVWRFWPALLVLAGLSLLFERRQARCCPGSGREGGQAAEGPRC